MVATRDPAFSMELPATDEMSEPERVFAICEALASSGNSLASEMASELLVDTYRPEWSAEWAIVLVTVYLVPSSLLPPPLASLPEHALDALSYYFNYHCQAAAHPPTLVAAILRTTDPATCTLREDFAVSLAQTIAHVLRTSLVPNEEGETDECEYDVRYSISRDYDGGRYERGYRSDDDLDLDDEDRGGTFDVDDYSSDSALSTCDHDEAVEYAVQAMGRVLGWPTRDVADAHTLLLELIRPSAPSLEIRYATLAALATWAATDYDADTLHEDPELVPHLISLIVAGADHLTLQTTHALLKPLVTRTPLLNPSLVVRLMAAIVATRSYCDMDLMSMCAIRQSQLRLMATIATDAFEAARSDILVALAHPLLGPWLARCFSSLFTPPEFKFDAFEPVLRFFRAFQRSGVEEDPVWGGRGKVKRWYTAMSDDVWRHGQFQRQRNWYLLDDVQRGFGLRPYGFYREAGLVEHENGTTPLSQLTREQVLQPRRFEPTLYTGDEYDSVNDRRTLVASGWVQPQSPQHTAPQSPPPPPPRPRAVQESKIDAQRSYEGRRLPANGEQVVIDRGRYPPWLRKVYADCECHYCGRTFPTWASLQGHLFTTRDHAVYLCCEHTFAAFSGLQQHIANVHGGFAEFPYV
ncbi:hypothetical protein BC828DRAFT_397003 [Blastocladiella britannica]|nr:hypothetical protein BC828DRAFT_397003 [Blastocladiella britannica]